MGQTLILTDLASNVVEFARPVHRLMTQAYGIPVGFGSPRNARLLLRADRAEARRALGKALEWPFERILVGHGARVEVDARDRFHAAFAEFLAPRPTVK